MDIMVDDKTSNGLLYKKLLFYKPKTRLRRIVAVV